jgi:uncharacterized repeat protein (TIGR01451 family)
VCCTNGDIGGQGTTDVRLTKAVSQDTVAVGEEFEYTIRVDVLQADPISGAQRVVVVDRLPAGLEFAGPAPAGDL